MPSPIKADQTDLESKLTRIAELKRVMDAAKALKPEFDALKDEVYVEMQLAQSDKSKPSAGIYGLIVRKVVPWISNPEALEHWLLMGGYAPHDYQTTPELSVEKIDAIAKQALKLDGEIAPGFEYRTVESLQIRQAK